VAAVNSVDRSFCVIVAVLLSGSVDLEELRRVVMARQLTHGAGRRLREGLGVSLDELAAAMGVNGSQLSRWERGLASPRPKGALRWLAALDELLGEDR
jgi:DNA-binding transcriptional regulator YiaG